MLFVERSPASLQLVFGGSILEAKQMQLSALPLHVLEGHSNKKDALVSIDKQAL